MSLTQKDDARRYLWHAVVIALSLTFPLRALAEAESSVRFSEGWNAYETGDYPAAVAIWSGLAEQGHANAQINLGVMYDHGIGIEQDHQTAARWYRAAAIQNNAAGQYNLSLLIAEGNATPLGGRSARYWMERAAAQGFTDAQEAIGRETKQAGNTASVQASIQPEHSKDARMDFERPNHASWKVPVSIGTAWPVANGYAVTSHHIIDGKQRITLIDSEGEELPAVLVAVDAAQDIALLGVSQPNRLPPALPLSPYDASLGASVFTIGFPRVDVMGKSPKLSNGIVSATNGLRDDPLSYQISVPIQQGNSGGPLFNMRGEVVGMITTMLGERNPGGGALRPIPNVGYALKADAIRRLLSQADGSAVYIDELRPAAGDLEDLASRVKDSVLTVMAE